MLWHRSVTLSDGTGHQRAYLGLRATNTGGIRVKFLELFSGIGGFRRGLENAGHECVGWIEWDKFARQSYQAIWPAAEKEWNAHDITTVRASDIPRAHIWAFGSPCQDLSVAGRRAGITGSRSGLFLTVVGLLSTLEEASRPEWLLFENVKGLFSSNHGWDFLIAQTEMAEVGYDTEYELFNATDFGIPQNRERVFVVGHLRIRGRQKVFPLRVDGVKDSAELKELTQGVADAFRVYDANGIARNLKAEGGTGVKTGLYQMGVVRKGRGEDAVYSEREIALTIDANYYKGLDAHQARTGVAVRAVLTPDREEKRQNGRRIKGDGEPMFTLTAQDRHGVMIAQRGRGFNPGGLHEIAPTVSSCSYQDNNHVVTQLRIRRLTPRETWRLMGREDWEFDKAQSAGVSDSQLYKQAGNSLIPIIVQKIAEKISQRRKKQGGANSEPTRSTP